MLAAVVSGFRASPSRRRRRSPTRSPIEAETTFGIKIVSLRPTAAGQMLDLRFQVIDPEKAKPVLDKNNKAYMLDGKTGKTLPVPVTKAGSMRQTTLKPEAGGYISCSFPTRAGWSRKAAVSASSSAISGRTA